MGVKVEVELRSDIISRRQTGKEKEAIVFEPGQGKFLTARGSEMFFKAVGATTNGTFSLMERTLPPGGRRPPAHIHAGCEEAYYVLDGNVDFAIGTRTYIGRPRSFILVPRGVPHTFGNGGTVPARLLVLHAPPLDAYFEELQSIWSGDSPPTPEEELALMQRHGMEPAAVSGK
jgi:mannose-6-phosphate isomerase-like protein (cupin superfamily)